MKKIIALFICALLVLQVCPAFGATEGAVAQTIYTINFENGTVGANPPKGSTNYMVSGYAENTGLGDYVRIGEETEGGNKVLHLYRSADSTETAGIRAACNLNLVGYETLTASARVRTYGGATGFIQMHTASGNVTLASVSSDTWVTVRMEFDLPNRVCYVTIGDGEPTTKTLKADWESTSTSLRYNATDMRPGTGVYYDDIYIGTYDEDVYIRQSPIAGKQVVYWEYVLPENAIGADSYTTNLKASHPRVLVQDWDVMRGKINNGTTESEKWYAGIKAIADNALSTSPQKYVDDNGHLKLYAARNARDRMQALSFVYNIEKDARYLNKAYEEMLYYGTYKNWSGFGQTLVCAEILNGFACAYDWLYNDLDAAQKRALIEIMKTQALAGYVYHYEGMMDWSFSTISINWNPVCNASVMMAAIAMADEEAQISEYMLERALPSLTKAFAPYAPSGAYPEGVSYWDYGTTFLVFADYMMETSFKDGFAVADAYRPYLAQGLEDTCDFAIYMNGPKGRFDYGDCVTGYTSCEVLYWAAEKYNKPHYAWWENQIQANHGYLTGYSAIASLLWYNPEHAQADNGAFALDKFYNDTTSKFNGFSARSSWEEEAAMFTAMQGGINKGSHMHQSLGTYVIDFGGKRFVKQASGANYDLANEEASNVIYGHRAESSNCLVVNPTTAYDQKYGAFAPLAAQGRGAEYAYGVLDMLDVYSTLTNEDGTATVTAAKRGIKLFDNRSRIVVQDELTLTSPSKLYWFASTDAAVTIADDGQSAVLDVDGVKMLARILAAPSGAEFAMMDRKSVVEEGVINNITTGQKLVISMADVVGDATVAVEYVPLTAAENLPQASAVRAIDTWGWVKTETTYAKSAQGYTFTTEVYSEKQSGILVLTLKNNGKTVAVRMQKYEGQANLTTEVSDVAFDSATVMLIDSFFNMRVSAPPETL